MPYVFSTLSCDNRYTSYTKTNSDIQVPSKGILIKGGAGVMNDRFITPMGVVTEVSKEELDILESNPVFRLHKEKGFIVVQDKKSDVDKVASVMNQDDGGSPLTDEKIRKMNRSKNSEVTVVTNNEE
ncbi:hypothetical protein EV694_1702 [Volucribacter psittacicida]|uniref:Uncharacterized protein n=1 Tax=Volucribacter psittacicida TaxID=203482 RepID=A0A4R1FPS8_9PAST|nr:hypothetical protein [Volucribacter psittacicida]TCJ96150.1 hypothetical protein EV694_1702 [Volucribacter psittacicida]